MSDDKKIYLDYPEIYRICKEFTEILKKKNEKFDILVAITRGGLVPTGILAQLLDIKDVRVIGLSSYVKHHRKELQVINPLVLPQTGRILFIDDILDSGETIRYLRETYCSGAPVKQKTIVHKNDTFNDDFDDFFDDDSYIAYTKPLRTVKFFTLVAKPKSPYKDLLDFKPTIVPNKWIVFPWEEDFIFSNTPTNIDTNNLPEGHIIGRDESGIQKVEVLPLDRNMSLTIKKPNSISLYYENVNKIYDMLISLRTYYEVTLYQEFVQGQLYSQEGFALTQEQKEVIYKIENSKHKLILLTGRAGAGKSTIIKELLARNPKWVILATTGRAAINIGGKTVDSFFLLDRETWTVQSKKFVAHKMSRIGDAIIIDESSMMGAHMFKVIYEWCQKYGKKLILVGDWGQASPVKEPWIFTDADFRNNVTFIKLTENHRQNDKQFLDVLDLVRHGIVTPEVNELLESRAGFSIPKDDSCVVLYPTNKETKAYNDFKVKECSSKTGNEIFTLYSNVREEGKTKLTPVRRNQLLDYSPFAHDEDLCVGCKVLITMNELGDERHYVNGDTGILVSRLGQDFLIELDRTGELVNVGMYTRVYTDAEKKPEYSISGYPLKAGYALTIHKCQGLTIPKVYVDLSRLATMSFHGVAYVALSRVRHLEDLYLKEWIPSVVYCERMINPLL